MKSISRTIDRILKVDPALEPSLLPIKEKAKRYPSRTGGYWKELLGFLNSSPLQAHPKRKEIKDIVTAIRTPPKKVYTFDDVAPNDKVVGIIPGHLADMIRRQDVASIRLAKGQVEANMTRNTAMMAKLARDEAVIEIGMRKMWLGLKDHFGLWDKTATFTIKRGPAELVLIEIPPQPQQRSMIMPMPPEMLRGLFGMPPPEE